jgi:predicted transposase YbfD/YdcC
MDSRLISAQACQQCLSLGQVATDKKSNEINATPALLKLLDIKGVLITIDVKGCQTAIAAQIIQQKGDYVLALKGNQGQLHEAVVDYFDTAQADMQHKETLDCGHGRIETRTHYLHGYLHNS